MDYKTNKKDNNFLGYYKFGLFSIIFLISLLVYTNGFSCTIFYAVQNGIILAGNNEDWKDPATHMWFYPSTDSTFGWIKFGFGGGFPQGGMNEAGLFWDGTAGPYLDMPYSEANKILYDGPIMRKVIEKSANTLEATEIFNQFYCEDQYRAQYLLGDSLGNSIIVEGDNVIINESNYQVLTNFYQSFPELGGYPCWRYETAVEYLENCDSLTTWYAGTVLASTHQEGKYPTQYSNIYNLKNRIIYLFFFHNYEEFLTINLSEELGKGYNTYNIPKIFSKMNILNPADGATISGSSTNINWEGLPYSQYEILLSTDPGFSETLIICYKSTFLPTNQSGKVAIIIPVILIISLFVLNGRCNNWYPVTVIICLCLLVNCDKENAENENSDNTTEFSEVIEKLEPNTTYYWKIRASSGYTDNFSTETLVYSFKTLSN